MTGGYLSERLRRWTDHTMPGSLAARFRSERLSKFAALLEELPRPVKVLDIGGEAGFWENVPRDILAGLEVTLLNKIQAFGDPRFRRVRADAGHLPFLSDRKFDVVFSNSVIEHLGSLENQARMAAEVRRVGERYFIQTPSRWFPLEPHFLFPLFQFLPFACRVWIASRYRVGWYCHPGDPAAARREVASIRLLTAGECRRLFPGAEILVERMFGWTKSYMIIGRQPKTTR